MKAIVSLSGGMDSATALAEAVHAKRDVQAVGFWYGSKHGVYENAAAVRLAAHYGVPFHLIDLCRVMEAFRSDLLLTGGKIPEGHYEADSMRRTVVPGRNTIFASVLLGLAQSVGAGEVWLGIHQGDHHIYPDCRPNWFVNMRAVMEAASEEQVTLRAPFLDAFKTSILRRGLMLGVPYQHTRTCYKDQDTACGKCGSCQERLEAFRLTGAEDPLEYESREILPKE